MEQCKGQREEKSYFYNLFLDCVSRLLQTQYRCLAVGSVHRVLEPQSTQRAKGLPRPPGRPGSSLNSQTSAPSTKRKCGEEER